MRVTGEPPASFAKTHFFPNHVAKVIDILVLIIISVAAVRSANTLRRAGALFTEFEAPRTVIPLIYLFPLGPLVYFLLSPILGWLLALPCSLACYLPALLALKKVRLIFERSGTDRTQGVQNALGVVFITGLGGLAYVLVAAAVELAATVSST